MRKQKVIILVGIPGSGKSTWAREFQKEKGSYVRLNRDDYRLMLKNETFCYFKIEEAITIMQNEAIMTALSSKLNVIVDNTHVNLSYINNVVELVKHNADISFKVFDTPLEVCIERDSKRLKPVDPEIIKKMYDNFIKLKNSFDFKDIPAIHEKYIVRPFKIGLPSAFIFDIDGTIAHVDGKRDIFDYSKVIDDSIDIHTSVLLDSVRKTNEIIFVTGREESCRKETVQWLDKWGLGEYPLYMRPLEDRRKDTILKKEIFENIIEPKYNVIGVFEDRVSVVEMYRKLGLKVYQVNSRKF